MGKLFRRIFCNMDPVLFLCTLGLSGISILTIVGAVDNFGMSKLKTQIATGWDCHLCSDFAC